MSKILIVLAAAVVSVIGGYFGAEANVRHRVSSEIEANFAQIRANGGRASHGGLAVSLLHRSISLSDVLVDLPAPQPANIKVGRFVATGIKLTDGSTFEAGHIVLTDIEAGGAVALSGGMTISARAPRFEISDYAGPTQFQGEIKPTSPLDLYRAGLAQFAAIKATAMSAPSIAVKVSNDARSTSADYVYSDLSVRGIAGGRIATSSVAKLDLAMTMLAAGKPKPMHGDIVDLKASDIDTAALATVLDPAHAEDTQFYRIQGPVSTGAYTLTSDNGPELRIDNMRMGTTRIQPAKFKLQELLAAMPSPGMAPDPARVRLMLNTVATVYEGIQIDHAEMNDLTIKGRSGPVKLASLHFDLDRGKIGAFALEGIDGTTPRGAVKIGRFALKGIDFAGLMRQVSQVSAPGTTPSVDSAIGLLKNLEGIEIKDLVAPYNATGKTANLETASLSWGQFVGPLPSNARLTFKMISPIDESDGELFALLDGSGIDSATIGADVGLTWDEKGRKLTLSPGVMDIEGLFALTAETSFDDVDRNLFSTDPQQLAIAALFIKPGPLKLTLRDLGGLDLLITQTARKQGTGVDAERGELLATIQSNAQAMADSNPAAGKVAAALAAFIEKPRSTLTLSLSPKQKLPVLQLVQMLKASGPDVLSMFDMDAQAGP